MTQPREPVEPTGPDVALLAVEARAQQRAKRDLAAIAVFGAALVVAANTDPTATATALFSTAAVHTALTAALEQSRAASRASIGAAYQAGAQVGRATAVIELRALGHAGDSARGDLGEYLDVLLRDVGTIYDHALFDIHNTVRAKLDTAIGDDRLQAVRDAIDEVRRRLASRLSATLSVAVHRGYTDGQRAVWDDYAVHINPYVVLRKVWRTNGVDPCTECAALDGMSVDIDDEFPHNADPDGRHLPVHRDLLGPPRHPNCRCRIVLE